MKLHYKNIFIISSIFLISSCGGGGGGGSAVVAKLAAVITSFASSLNTSEVGSTVDISWSSTNSSSCTAAGSWSGTKSTSGTESVTISSTGSNSFALTCIGEGGNDSSSLSVDGFRNIAGITVDGYITGASIFIDQDDNYTNDSTEDSTTSDSSGSFIIKHSNGVLASIGGQDLDTMIQVDNLMLLRSVDGYSDSNFSITPVTTIANFLPGENLYNLLGIDASIDFLTVDPVAAKGDGGINDFHYEKGNQLTILALSLYNVKNDLVSGSSAGDSTKDYFKAIAEEIKIENASTSNKVDIENETFISKVLDNLIAAKSITISDVNKSNTVKALSTLMPLVEVKASDDITTAVMRFGISTMQTDIVSIANGTADSTLVNNYTNNILSYISTDQSIDQSALVTGVSAINDTIELSEDTSKTFSPASNDSLAVSGSFDISTSTPSNGTVTTGEGGVLTYTPQDNFNGTDSFNYTITQGSKSGTAMVSVIVNAVNDSPSINVASTLSVNENTKTVGSISVSDVDSADTLDLTMGGTDAGSFDLSSTYQLSFKSAPDYETKNSYSLSFSLTDGTETVTKSISITINNLNDVAPVINSSTSFNIAENSSAIGTLSIVDPEGGTYTFTIGGADGALINVSNAGVMTFKTAPDFETKASYSFTVTVSDGVNSSSKTFTISITNLDELPTTGYSVPKSIDVIETQE
jgi:hypothetical protein